MRVNVVLLRQENIPELARIVGTPAEELNLIYKEHDERNEFCIFTMEMTEEAYMEYKTRSF